MLHRSIAIAATSRHNAGRVEFTASRHNVHTSLGARRAGDEPDAPFLTSVI